MENVTSVNRRIKNPLNSPIEHIARRYGGEKPKELERFLRFAVVGIIGAVIDLSILTILQSTLLPPATIQGDPAPFNVGLATTIAFISAVISNFIWTTLWVYPDSQTYSKRKQLISFVFISIVGWLARTIWVTSMFSIMGNLLMPILEPLIHIVKPEFIASEVTTKKIGSISAQLIAMVFVMFWNFFANRYWTYNDVD